VRTRRAPDEVVAGIEPIGRKGWPRFNAMWAKISDGPKLHYRSRAQLGKVAILGTMPGPSVTRISGTLPKRITMPCECQFEGVFFITQAFRATCKELKSGGKVINVSSVHEELPFPALYVVLCASKAG